MSQGEVKVSFKVLVPVAIGVLSYAVTIAIAYANLRSDLNHLKGDCEKMEEAVFSNESNIITLDKNVAVMSEKQDKILEYVTDIRDRIK